jgi:chemotaxis-related protein WspB
MLLLTFTVGPNRYAVDVGRVIEVVPRVDLRPIPHAPAFLAGLMAYRGKVVPVVELGLLLGTMPSRSCLSTRIILVDATPDARNAQIQVRNDPFQRSERTGTDHQRGLNVLGLIAEHVTELTSAQPGQTLPLPVPVPEATYLDAVVQTPDGIVQLILVQNIRDTILRRADIEPMTATLQYSQGPEHTMPASAKSETEADG